jgi:hypothetical protein
MFQRAKIWTLFLCGSTCVAAWASDVPSAQQRFGYALQQLEQDPALSVPLLTSLLQDTQAVRVKLELGRALYLSGSWESARQVFVEVLTELPANTPNAVRHNVERFLVEINHKLNPLQFGIGLVKDSNPTQSTKPQKVRLFGLDFDYEPSQPAKDELGLRFSANYTQKPAQRWEWSALGSYTQFESKNHTRLFIQPELRYLLEPNLKLWLRGGLEHEGQNNKTVRQANYVGLRKMDIWPKAQLSTVLDARWVNNRFPQFDFVNGRTADIQASATYRPSPRLSVSATVGFEDVNAKDSSYASNARMVGLSTGLLDAFAGLNVTLSVRQKNRKYAKEDVFFGILRKDKELTHSIGFEKNGFYVFGLKPAVEFVFEKRKSNIGIAEFDRKQFLVTGTKLY